MQNVLSPAGGLEVPPSLVDNVFWWWWMMFVLNVLNVLNVCLNAKCLEPLRWLRVWWIISFGGGG